MSFGLEILASALLSPVTMLSQAGQCVSVLRGADGGWEAQRRDGDAISLAEGWRLGWRQCALGLVLLGLALAIAPALAAWMIPVILGLVIAPWLISVTSSETLGLALQRRGLLATPWEQRPSALLRMAAHNAA